MVRWSTFHSGEEQQISKSVPARELPLLETLWERIVAIQPSTKTAANFLSSKKQRVYVNATTQANSHIAFSLAVK